MAQRTNTGVDGIDEVMRNLSKAVRDLEEKSTKGVLEAVAYIREDMDSTEPVIPVDTGNLRGSWFTNFIKVMNKKMVKMGFSANYAVFVHEMVDENNSNGAVNWNRPGSGAKFFEKALKRNKDKILAIIARESKI